MKLILVRHGIAVDAAPSDPERALSEEGERRTRLAARGLRTLLGGGARIVTSPYTRARQTAEILAAALEAAPVPETCDALAIGGDVGAALQLACDEAAGGKGETVVLVGHEPGLSELASWLLVEGDDLDLLLKKASALCIGFSGRPEVGAGRLEWFVPPRVLRQLGTAPSGARSGAPDAPPPA